MNINHNFNLVSRIFKSIFFNQMPNYAVIFIDGKCNMHCGFCCHAAMDARKTPIISAENWGKVFKNAKSLLHLTEFKSLWDVNLLHYMAKNEPLYIDEIDTTVHRFFNMRYF